MDQVKGDIEERFSSATLHPTEYYEFRLQSGDRDVTQQSRDKQPDRTGGQEHKSRSGKSRDRHVDRDR
jgi:hypothetical protein